MTKLNDTIVACATPAGYSSIAVIRISGNNVFEIIGKVFRPAPVGGFETRRIYFGKIFDAADQDTIDRVMISAFSAPNTYTGEDLVEISCHGNPQIIDRIIRLICGHGARCAERGEFTRRALLNGKIDLIQAEALADAVYASCDEARRLAMMSYEGKFSSMVHEFRTALIDLLVVAEASIDFPDEHEISLVDPVRTGSLKSLIDRIDDLVANAKIGQRIKNGYSVVIAGKANVGKSTLFNRLLGYDRSIVHRDRGTTRDYIEETTEAAGLTLRVFDTAGIIGDRSGPDEIAELRSIDLLKCADLVLLLFDGGEPMNEKDIDLYDRTKNLNTILVINKIDINLALETTGMLRDAIKVSALTGRNMDLLVRTIRSNLLPSNCERRVLLTRPRHLDILNAVRQYLANCMTAATPEIAAFELHSALEQLDELSGKVMRKDILDRIFEEFCVGK